MRDFTGRVVYVQDDGNTRLPLSHLSPGLYTLTLIDQAGSIITRKILKQ